MATDDRTQGHDIGGRTGGGPPGSGTRGGPEGGIHIGSVRGAFALGDHNTVTQNVGAQPARDPAQEELLAAVRLLRADLDRVISSPQTELLVAELEGTRTDIEHTGGADPGRLERLRAALADAGAVTGLLASGAAVAQAVTALLGG